MAENRFVDAAWSDGQLYAWRADWLALFEDS